GRLPVSRRHRQSANFSELLLQLVPGFSAVRTHVDVAIEARRSDNVGPLRVRREPVDDRIRLYWQLNGLPRLPTVLGALDGCGDPWDRVAIANKDDIGVISLQHDATTVRAVIRLVELGEIVILPVLPLIRAGGDVKRRGGINGRRLPRAQGQSMNIALEGVG